MNTDTTPTTILVIDDNVTNIKVLVETLQG